MALASSPRILRGAFVEFGLSIPPLFVVFQFNPEELSRSRRLDFAPDTDFPECIDEEEEEEERSRRSRRRRRRRGKTLREFHQERDDLLAIQKDQTVTVDEESLSFDIRLDAKDEIAEGNVIAAGFGILPRLATLELMMHPKADSLLGAALDSLLGLDENGFSFSKRANPPMILFIWGHKRVLPVNINSMSIRETEFSPLLDPVRATVSVDLTVIEGGDPLYKYSKVFKEVSSVLNLANIADVANVVVPG